MAANEEYAPSKELVNVVVRSSEKLEGATSLLKMLKDKADSQRITASELAAVRCIVEICANDLDAVLEQLSGAVIGLLAGLVQLMGLFRILGFINELDAQNTKYSSLHFRFHRSYVVITSRIRSKPVEGIRFLDGCFVVIV